MLAVVVVLVVVVVVMVAKRIALGPVQLTKPCEWQFILVVIVRGAGGKCEQHVAVIVVCRMFADVSRWIIFDFSGKIFVSTELNLTSAFICWLDILFFLSFRSIESNATTANDKWPAWFSQLETRAALAATHL